jgi:hypothetical protein
MTAWYLLAPKTIDGRWRWCWKRSAGLIDA